MVPGNMYFMLCLFLLLEIQERKSELFILIFFLTLFLLKIKRSAPMNPLVGTSEEDNAIIKKGECRLR
jgi:hypothetical protein